MYYGKIRENDIANGNGIRITLFVSGCRNHCKNCFQPETWDFKYGSPFTKETEDHILDKLKNPYLRGLTVLGGEPFEPENQPDVLRLIKRVKTELPNKDIWCYTGYTIEELLSENSRCHTRFTEELLSYIDTLVDGKFVEELKDISLNFRGSSNQRILNPKDYIKKGKNE